MFKSLWEYRDYILWVNRNKVGIDKHHVLPIAIYWPDISENIEPMLQEDHKKLHQELDIARRYLSTLTRNQRKRENGHIVLTTSDIEWRADLQRKYLEDVDKLPNFLQELHDVKLWDLATFEAKKFERLTGDQYPLEIGEVFQNHQQYIDIQKEASKFIYKKLKS